MEDSLIQWETVLLVLRGTSPVNSTFRHAINVFLVLAAAFQLEVPLAKCAQQEPFRSMHLGDTFHVKWENILSLIKLTASVVPAENL